MSQAVWGLDPSTRRLAAGFAYEEEALAASWDFDPNLRGAERLARVAWETELAAAQWAERHEPLVVFVEQPSGRYQKPELIYVCGVVAASTYRALSGLYAHPVSVFWLPSSKWKAHALNNGAADKEAVRRWAERSGLAAENQDEADALGIAVGGRRLVGKGEQASLV